MSIPSEQLGEEYLIGLGGAEYSATADVDDANVENDADEQIIKDDQGNTKTVITQDRRKVLTLNVMILAAGSFDPPVKNSLASVKAPGANTAAVYRTTSARITGRKGQVVQMAWSGVREASMAAVYDAPTPT